MWLSTACSREFMRPPYAFSEYYEPSYFYGTELANLPPEEWERFRPVREWTPWPSTVAGRLSLLEQMIDSGVYVQSEDVLLRLLDVSE